MKKILILVDYKGHFESKWNAFPYRSGHDLNKLIAKFNSLGYDCLVKNFTEIKVNDPIWNNYHIIYSSQEDKNYEYKSYIEDIVFGLETCGCNVYPSYKFLKANNNKVFMEILRSIYVKNDNLQAYTLGAIEELKYLNLTFPTVLKTSEGAMSRGVFLVKNFKELKFKLKALNGVNVFYILKERIRSFLHKGYVRESNQRKKTILQPFIPNLDSDFKVLIFGERYYIFERKNRKNDFRASGSGHSDYIYGSKVKVPKGLFDFSKEIFIKLKCPNLSIDVCHNKGNFYLLEFQSLFFGTVGHFKSDGYYINDSNEWKFVPKILQLEDVYAESMNIFIGNQSSYTANEE